MINQDSFSISVLTVSRNRGGLLQELYESLKLQSFRSFEWVLVDDASEDTTFQKVNVWLSEKILNIKYFQVHPWLGKAVGDNIAYGCASGEYVIEIDSDDLLLPSALEKMYCEIKRVNLFRKRRGLEEVKLLAASSIVTNNLSFYTIPKSDRIEITKLRNISTLKNYVPDGPLLINREAITSGRLPEVDYYVPLSHMYCELHFHDCIFLSSQLKQQRYQPDGITMGSSISYPKGRCYAIVKVLNTLGVTESLVHFSLLHPLKRCSLLEKSRMLLGLINTLNCCAIISGVGVIKLTFLVSSVRLKSVVLLTYFLSCYYVRKNFKKESGTLNYEEFERKKLMKTTLFLSSNSFRKNVS